MSSRPATDSTSPSPASEKEGGPPRKRPRTRAPPQAVASDKVEDTAATTIPMIQGELNPPAKSQTHRFPIQPLHRFQGASARIKRPQEVAHFSFDDKHQYVHDDSSINYYVPPPLGADLKEGFNTFEHYEEKEDAHLDALLKALIDTEKQNGEAARVNADFVTWRGMMTKVSYTGLVTVREHDINNFKIMTAPYDNFAEFSMFATRYHATIYIEEDFPSRAAQRAAENTQPPRHQHADQHSREMMTYWGYKFETLSLIPTPPSTTPPTTIKSHQNSTVSNYAQHCSIIHTSFGPHTLLLAGEVDGLTAPKPSSPDLPTPWLELKTTEQLPPPALQKHHHILKFERKLLRFWAQSFLLGVPQITVGFRCKNGILQSLQTFRTQDIPGMVRRGTRCWDGNVCINFTTAFLAWVKEVIIDEGVYRIELKKKSGVVEVRKVGEGVGSVVSEEFVKWRREGRGRDWEQGDGKGSGDDV